jgi:hypothetical protein
VGPPIDAELRNESILFKLTASPARVKTPREPTLTRRLLEGIRTARMQ